jgi:hypothetical protein
MYSKASKAARGAIAGLAILFAAACSDSTTALENVEVSNQTDTFQFQANAADVTETLTYNWSNTGTSANVNQSGTLTGGAATLTIMDDAGTQVYTRSLAETGTFETDAGVTGTWVIRVQLNGASGALNFRVEKP